MKVTLQGGKSEDVRVHKITKCSEALILSLTEEGPSNDNDGKCGQCNFRSTNRVLRNDHRNNIHPGFKCSRCGKIKRCNNDFILIRKLRAGLN